MSEQRRCEGPDCDRPIPPGARADRRFHAERCRVRAYDRRRRDAGPSPDEGA